MTLSKSLFRVAAVLVVGSTLAACNGVRIGALNDASYRSGYGDEVAVRVAASDVANTGSNFDRSLTRPTGNASKIY